MAEDEGVLRRWSRRKQAARRGEAAAEERAAAAGQAPAEEAPPPPDLPDVDSLTEESDFSAFLADGVPEAVQRLALRRLWRLNPVFANLDGLVDYGEDFTDAATVIEGMRTAYKVGQGLIVDEDEEEAGDGEAVAKAAEDVPAPAADDDAEPDDEEDVGNEEGDGLA